MTSNENDDQPGRPGQQRRGVAANASAALGVGDADGAVLKADDPTGHRSILGRVRIAHLVATRELGGLWRLVKTLGRQQSGHHTVAVAAPRSPDVPGVEWLPADVQGNSDLRGQIRLARRLAAWGADVVVAHAASPGEWALIASLARSAPLVVVEHAAGHFPLRRKLLDRAYRALKRRAAAWCAVSGASARCIEDMWGLPEGTVGVLHSGVDRPEGEASAAGTARSELQVIALGRPDEVKGHDVFLALALGSLPPARWLWVGAERRTRSGRLELVPWSPSPGEQMSAADLVLIPSRTEGLPLVLLEAWSLGKAVVASRVGGIPEVVDDGRDAVLAPPGDVEAWRDAVRRVLGDADLRRRLGEEGQRTWARRFTVEAMARRYEAVIRRVLEKR